MRNKIQMKQSRTMKQNRIILHGHDDDGGDDGCDDLTDLRHGEL